MFIVDNEERHFRGTLAYVSADNLGAQFIGGFKQGSQSHRKCRECMATDDQIQSMVRKIFHTHAQMPLHHFNLYCTHVLTVKEIISIFAVTLY